MTELQLAYLRDQEQARANRANEALKSSSLAVDKAKADASIALDEARRKGEEARTGVAEMEKRAAAIKAQQLEEAYGGLTAVWNNNELSTWQKIVRSADVLRNNKSLQEAADELYLSRESRQDLLDNILKVVGLGSQGTRRR